MGVFGGGFVVAAGTPEDILSVSEAGPRAQTQTREQEGGGGGMPTRRNFISATASLPLWRPLAKFSRAACLHRIR